MYFITQYLQYKHLIKRGIKPFFISMLFLVGLCNFSFSQTTLNLIEIRSIDPGSTSNLIQKIDPFNFVFEEQDPINQGSATDWNDTINPPSYYFLDIILNSAPNTSASMTFSAYEYDMNGNLRRVVAGSSSMGDAYFRPSNVPGFIIDFIAGSNTPLRQPRFDVLHDLVNSGQRIGHIVFDPTSLPSTFDGFSYNGRQYLKPQRLGVPVSVLTITINIIDNDFSSGIAVEGDKISLLVSNPAVGGVITATYSTSDLTSSTSTLFTSTIPVPATAGLDYVSVMSKTVIVHQLSRTSEIDVITTIDDLCYEGDEHFLVQGTYINFQNVTRPLIIGAGTSQVGIVLAQGYNYLTIIDNDPPPPVMLHFNDGTRLYTTTSEIRITEQTISGATPASMIPYTITVALPTGCVDPGVGNTADVTVELVPVTANANPPSVDFNTERNAVNIRQLTLQARFTRTITTVDIPLYIHADTDFEQDETFLIRVASRDPLFSNTTTNQFTIVIEDDDISCSFEAYIDELDRMLGPISGTPTLTVNTFDEAIGGNVSQIEAGLVPINAARCPTDLFVTFNLINTSHLSPCDHAVENVDFTPLRTNIFNYRPSTGRHGLITFDTIDDNIVEALERGFIEIDLSNSSPGYGTTWQIVNSTILTFYLRDGDTATISPRQNAIFTETDAQPLVDQTFAFMSPVSCITVTLYPITNQGEAEYGVDYNFLTQTLYFDTTSSKNVTISVLWDRIVEMDEIAYYSYTVTADPQLLSRLTVINQQQVPFYIRSDDEIDWHFVTTPLNEGDTGLNTYTIRGMLFYTDSNTSPPPPTWVTFTYHTQDVTALVVDNDYRADMNTFTVLVDTLNEPFDIDLFFIGDLKYERDENFLVHISLLTNSLVLSALHTTIEVAIRNDDSQPSLVAYTYNNSFTYASSPGNRNEYDPQNQFHFQETSLNNVHQITVCLALDQPSYLTYDVELRNVTPIGSPPLTDAADFAVPQPSPVNFQFTPGQMAQCTTFSINGDNIPEQDEQFAYSVRVTYRDGSAPTQFLLRNASNLPHFVVNIDNDDFTPFTAHINNGTSTSVLEGNTGVTLVTVTITRLFTPSNAATITYYTVDGTATSPSDFTAINNTALTYNSGDPLTTYIPLMIQTDLLTEPDEVFDFIASMSAVVSGYQQITHMLSVTIENDDRFSIVSCTFNPNNSNTIGEGSTTTTFIEITCNSNQPLAGNAEIAFDVSGRHLNINWPNFVSQGAVVVTIPAGNTRGTARHFIPNNNLVHDGSLIKFDYDRSNFVGYYDPFSTAGPAYWILQDANVLNTSTIYTITEDDMAEISLAYQSGPTLMESDDGTNTSFSVRIQSTIPIDYDVPVQIHLADIDAIQGLDYDFQPGVQIVTLTRASTSADFMLNVLGDNQFEPAESFIVSHSLVNTYPYISQGNSGLTHTIIDNDPINLLLTSTFVSATYPNYDFVTLERDTGQNTTMYFTLTIDKIAVGDLVTVVYSTSAPNPTFPNFIQRLQTVTLTSAMPTAVLDVTVLGDDLYEFNNDQFTLTVFVPAGDRSYQDLTYEYVVGIIEDDTLPTLSLVLYEGATNVASSTYMNGVVEVLSATRERNVGDIVLIHSLELELSRAMIETFVFIVYNTGNPNYIIGGPSGYLDVEDFLFLTPVEEILTGTIAPGQTSDLLANFNIEEDNIIEPDELFEYASSFVSHPQILSSLSGATVTTNFPFRVAIPNDDAFPFTVHSPMNEASLETAVITEGDVGLDIQTLTVRLQRPAASAGYLTYWLETATALSELDVSQYPDVRSIPSSVTANYAVGDSFFTITYQVYGDYRRENTEYVYINFFQPQSVNNYTDVQVRKPIRILDNDQTALVDVDINTIIYDEQTGNQQLIFDARLDTDSTSDISFCITPQYSGIATELASAADIRGSGNCLTITAGTLNRRLTYILLDDNVVELTEYLILHIDREDSGFNTTWRYDTANYSGTIFTVTMLDDDDAEIFLSYQSGPTLIETDDGINALFSITVDSTAPIAYDVPVQIHLTDISAVQGLDYDYRAGVQIVTLTQNSTSIDFGLEIIGDNQFEPAESFIVSHSLVNSYPYISQGSSGLTHTIMDNDPINLLLTSTFVSATYANYDFVTLERDTGQNTVMYFTLTIDKIAVGDLVTVVYSTSVPDPISPDFVQRLQTVTLTSAMPTAVLDIIVLGDDLYEFNNDQFTLTLFVPAGDRSYTDTIREYVVGIIEDDTLPTFSLVLDGMVTQTYMNGVVDVLTATREGNVGDGPQPHRLDFVLSGRMEEDFLFSVSNSGNPLYALGGPSGYLNTADFEAGGTYSENFMVRIPSGTTVFSTLFTISSDNVVEPDELFEYSSSSVSHPQILSSLSGAAATTNFPFRVAIPNDDAFPFTVHSPMNEASLETAVITEGDMGLDIQTLTVRLLRPAVSAGYLSYWLETATALSELDVSQYPDVRSILSSVTFNYAAGTSFFTITYQVYGDYRRESTEYVYINFFQPQSVNNYTDVQVRKPIRILDNDQTALVDVDINTIVYDEQTGNQQLIFDVRLDTDSTSDISFCITPQYSGIATQLASAADIGLGSLGNCLTITAGTINRQLSFVLLDDNKVENTEYLILHVGNEDIGFGTTWRYDTTSYSGSIFTVTLLDDDDAEISVDYQSGSTLMEGDDGVNTLFSITVHSSAPIDYDVPVQIHLADIDAIQGLDYDFQPGVQIVTLTRASTSADFMLNVLGDNQFEPAESFIVSHSLVNTYPYISQGNSGLTHTIIDNDPINLLLTSTFVSATYPNYDFVTLERDTGQNTTMYFTLTIDKIAVGDLVTVVYSTSAPNPTFPNFIQRLQTVTLTSAMPTAVLDVTVLGDDLYEFNNDQFTLTVFVPAGDRSYTDTVREYVVGIIEDDTLPMLSLVLDGMVTETYVNGVVDVLTATREGNVGDGPQPHHLDFVLSGPMEEDFLFSVSNSGNPLYALSGPLGYLNTDDFEIGGVYAENFIVRIPSGTTVFSTLFTISSDNVVEPDELFVYSSSSVSHPRILSSLPGATSSSNFPFRVAIPNDDAFPFTVHSPMNEASLDTAVVTEGDVGIDIQTLTVRLLRPAVSAGYLTYWLETATALSELDVSQYPDVLSILSSVTYNYAAGTSFFTITYQVYGDYRRENTEYVYINFFQPQSVNNYTDVRVRKPIQILDNDQNVLVDVDINSIVYDEQNGNQQLIFDVRLDTDSTSDISFCITPQYSGIATQLASAADISLGSSGNCLTITAGSLGRQLRYTLLDDNVVELTEYLILHIDREDSGFNTTWRYDTANYSGTIFTVTLLDDDDAIFAARTTSLTLPEGHFDASFAPILNTYTIEFYVVSSIEQTYTLEVSINDINATNGVDFSAQTTTILTFTPNQNSILYSYTIRGDERIEYPERFSARLIDRISQNVLLDQTLITLTIEDDDRGVFGFGFRNISNILLTQTVSHAEDDLNVTVGERLTFGFINVLPPHVTSEVTLTLSLIDGSAVNTGGNFGDYRERIENFSSGNHIQNVPFTLTSNNPTISFEITINGDFDLEPDEIFFIQAYVHTSPVNDFPYTVIQTIGILTNDFFPQLLIKDQATGDTIHTYTSAEGPVLYINEETGTNPVLSLYFELSDPAPEEMNVDIYADYNGFHPPDRGVSPFTQTLIQQNDLDVVTWRAFTGPGGSGTIPPFETENYNFPVNATRDASTSNIRITINADSVDEPDEELFLIGIEDSATTAPRFIPRTGVETAFLRIIILDDDLPAFNINVAGVESTAQFDSASVVEGTGVAAPIVVTVTHREPATQLFTLTVQAIDGLAMLGSDYVQSATYDLGFNVGEQTKTFIYYTVPDRQKETDESFVFRFTPSANIAPSVSYPFYQRTVTIINDDFQSLVNVSLLDSVTLTSRTLELAPGDLSPIHVVVRIDTAVNSPVSFDLLRTDTRSALEPADRFDIAPLSDQVSINIPANVLLYTATIYVSGDYEVEAADEYLFYEFDSFGFNHSVTWDFDVDERTALLTHIIYDDDITTLTYSIQTNVLVEGDVGTSAVYTVTFILSNPVKGASVFALNTSTPMSNDTATINVDYEWDNGSTISSVRFPGGVTQIMRTFTLIGDNLCENQEGFSRRILVPTVYSSRYSSTQSFLSFFFEDNDNTNSGFITYYGGVATGTIRVRENVGTLGLSFSTGKNPDVADSFNLQVRSVDGLAQVSDNDYNALVTDAVLIRNAFIQTSTLIINDDNKHEPLEELVVSYVVSSCANYPDNVYSVTIEIENDDSVPTLSVGTTNSMAGSYTNVSVVSVTQAEGDVGDSGTRTLVFWLSNPQSSALTVVLSNISNPGLTLQTVSNTIADSDDFLASSQPTQLYTVVIPSGSVSASIVFEVNPDNAPEQDEYLVYALTTITPDILPAGLPRNNLRFSLGILNDDSLYPFSVLQGTNTISGNRIDVLEGDSAPTLLTLTVRLSKVARQSGALTYWTQDIDAVAGDDYVGVPTRTINYPIGSRFVTITLNISGDIRKEHDERFRLNLFMPSTVTLYTDVTVSYDVNIVNDDFQSLLSVSLLDSVTLSSRTLELAPNELSPVHVVVRIDTWVNHPVSFDLLRADTLTALEPADRFDIDPLSERVSINIPANVSLYTATIYVLGDYEVEAIDEYLFYGLDSFGFNHGVTWDFDVDETTALLTHVIYDDDITTLTYSVQTNVVEGDVGDVDVYTITFSLTNPIKGGGIFSFVNGTPSSPAAINGTDYALYLPGTVDFMGVSTTDLQTFSIIGDNLCESTEQFEILISPVDVPAGRVAIQSNTLAIDIVDNDNTNSGFITYYGGVATGTIRVRENVGTLGLSFSTGKNPDVADSFNLQVRSVDGLAQVSDNDYNALVTDAVLIRNAFIQTSVLVINDDLKQEPLEELVVSYVVSSCANYPDNVYSVTIEIENDDSVPTLSVGTTNSMAGSYTNVSVVSVTQAEGDVGDSGTRTLVFWLSNPQSSALTVVLSNISNPGLTLQTVSNTIADSDDFLASSQPTQLYTVVIPSGSVSASIVFEVNPDNAPEQDEYLVYALTTITPDILPAGLPRNNLRFSLGILNDDALYPFSVLQGTNTISGNRIDILEGDSGSTLLTLTVRLSKVARQPGELTYWTQDIDAVAGDDYVGVPTRTVISYPMGTRFVTVTLDISGDIRKENDERFRLNLFMPVTVTLYTDVTISPEVNIVNDDFQSLVNVSLLDSVTLTSRTLELAPGDLSPVHVVVRIDTWVNHPVSFDLLRTDTLTALEPADRFDIDGSSRRVSISIPANVLLYTATIYVSGDYEVEAIDEYLFYGFDSFGFNHSVTWDFDVDERTALLTHVIYDDDITTLTYSVLTNVVEGDVGGVDVYTITFSLSNPIKGGGSFSFVNGTPSPPVATNGTDYDIYLPGAINFMGASTTDLQTFSIIGDNLCEATEQFEILISSVAVPAGRVSIQSNTLAIDIVDNDNTNSGFITYYGGITTGTIRVRENVGTLGLSFSTGKNPDVADSFNLQVRSMDGLAQVSDGDYNALVTDAVLIRNAFIQTSTLVINDDNKHEPLEELVVSYVVSSCANYGDNTYSVTIEIENDDINPILSVGTTNSMAGSYTNVSVVSVTQAEGDVGDSGTRTLVFWLSNPQSSALTVVLSNISNPGLVIQTPSNTVADSADFLASSQPTQLYTVVIPSGSVSASIVFEVNPDNAPEQDEYLVYALTTITPDILPVGLPRNNLRFSLGILNDDADYPFSVLQGTNTISGNRIDILEGDSGSTLLTLTVRLSKVARQPGELTYWTQDIHAVAGDDYVGVPTRTVISYPTGSRFVTVTLDISGDIRKENDERFRLNLFMPVTVTQYADVTVPYDVNILNDDIRSFVELDFITSIPGSGSMTFVRDNRIEQDTGNNGMFFIRASLDTISTVPVQFEMRRLHSLYNNNENYVSTGDIQASNYIVNIAPGTLFYDVRIEIIGDNNLERDEWAVFEPAFFDLNYGTLWDFEPNENAPLTFTIVNDDTITITYTLPSTSSIEPPVNQLQGITVRFNLTSPTFIPIDVNVVLESQVGLGVNSATYNDDYFLNQGLMITIPPGPNTYYETVCYNIFGDGKYELDESFLVRFNVNGALAPTITLNASNLYYTIEDDGISPLTFAFAGAPGLTSLDIVEGSDTSGGSVVSVDCVISLTRPLPPGGTQQFIYYTMDGTADSTTPDYIPQSLNTVTLSNSNSEVTTTIIISQDETFENDEYLILFFEALMGAGSYTNVMYSRTINIINDDFPPTLSVTVETMVLGIDDSDIYQFNLPELDRGDQPTRTFIFELSKASEVTSTIVLENIENPFYGLQSQGTTLIDSSDFTTIPPDVITITFNPLDNREEYSFIMNPDIIPERDERIGMQFVVLDNIYINDLLANNYFLNVNFEDDDSNLFDVSSPNIDSNGVYRRYEGNGATTMFSFTLNLLKRADRAGAYFIRTTLITADGTDFQFVSLDTLTFVQGQQTLVVNIPVFGDITYENDEDFLVEIMLDSNFVGSTSNISEFLTVTILNDDAVPRLTVNVSGTSYPYNSQDLKGIVMSEGTDTNLTNYTVHESVFRLDRPSQLPITLEFSSTNAGLNFIGYDYADNSDLLWTANSDVFSLTFAPLEMAVTYTFNVVPDNLVEYDEVFNYEVEVIAGRLQLLKQDPTLPNIISYQIVDDDIPILTPSFLVSQITVPEGDNYNNFINVPLRVENAGSPVTLFVTSQDGTAQAIDFDYKEINQNAFDYRFTYDPILGGTQTMVITSRGDYIFEPDEFYEVTIRYGSNLLHTFTLSLLNDDRLPELRYTFSNRTNPRLTYTGVERQSGIYDIRLSFYIDNGRYSKLPIDIVFRTKDYSAKASEDYVAAYHTLTINPLDTSTDYSIQIKGDTKFEADEHFLVEILTVTNATLHPLLSEVTTLTIKNDDLYDTDFYNVLEGNIGSNNQLKFALVKEYETVTQTVYVSTTELTALVSDNDFVPLNSFPVVFSPGETVKDVFVDIVGDEKLEFSEELILNIVSQTTAYGVDLYPDGANDRARILNDDEEPYIFVSFPAGRDIVEGDCSTCTFFSAKYTPFDYKSVPVMFTLSNPSSFPVSFIMSSTSGTALEVDDFPPVYQTISFATGQTKTSGTLFIQKDNFIEPDEQFFVSLEHVPNNTNPLSTLFKFVTDLVTLTIINDDFYITTPTIDNVIYNGAKTITGKINPDDKVTQIEAILVDADTGMQVVIATATFDQFGTFTITLPNAATAGQMYYVKIVNGKAEADSITSEVQFPTISFDDFKVIYPTDPPPTPDGYDFGMLEGNSGLTTYTFSIPIQGVIHGVVTVSYRMRDGTGLNPLEYADNDYSTQIYSKVVITANATELLFTISVNGDTYFEGNENFSVDLYDLEGILFSGSSQGVKTLYGLVYNDDDNDDVYVIDNRISPNSDNVGYDVLLINNIDRYPDNDFWLYDKYGHEVFKVSSYDNSDPEKSFRGQDNNGETLVSGVYFYVLKYVRTNVFVQDEKVDRVIKGFITIRK